MEGSGIPQLCIEKFSFFSSKGIWLTFENDVTTAVAGATTSLGPRDTRPGAYSRMKKSFIVV